LISDRGLDAMTTAAVVAYYAGAREARISYAGHPPILYKRENQRIWSYAKRPDHKKQGNVFAPNIPLSIELDTYYEEFTIALNPGDRLFVYSDGIIDTPNPEGERFGLNRLKDFLDASSEASLSELKSTVLEVLDQYAKNDLRHDDITLIALEIC
jgi:phosphoserine phosphatase RsbU/P